MLQNNGYSQCESINCENNTTSGSNPSAIGYSNSATGDYSFVGGQLSGSSGKASFSFGQQTFALDNYAIALGRSLEVHGSNSFAVGRYLKTLTPDAIIIGYGFSATETMNNNVFRSLMIGFGSTKPTFFVGESIGVNSTGKIGIGNVTDPQAKLHIRADALEDASLLLEPSDPRQKKAKLQMMDANTGLTAGINTGLQLFTDLGQMQFTAGQFNFEGPVKVAALEVNGAYSLPTSAGTSDQFLRADGTWASPSGGGGESYWQPSGSTIYYNGGNVGIGTNTPKATSLV